MKSLIKQLLRENLLTEITLDKPYVKNGEFNLKYKPWVETYETAFKDELGNDITIAFIKSSDKWLALFEVNGDQRQAYKSSVSHYLRVMATIFEALLQFIEEVSPKIIGISGTDKEGASGQKNRIYDVIANNNKNKFMDLGYSINKTGAGMELIKNNYK